MRLGLQALALALSTTALAGCGVFQQQAETSHAQVTLRVADAALASGAPDVALRVADLVLDRQPNNVEALVAKGNALYAMGVADQARDAYQSAVAVDASNVAAQIGLGRTLVRSDPHAAETHFLAALAKQQDNVIALNNLGIARDLQGHHAEAQQAYHQALAIAPEMTDVKTNLGLSLALAGQGNQAVRMLQPIATAPDATAMKRADLAVALAQQSDRGPTGPVKEQQAQAATLDFDAPIAINRAPIASVESQVLPPRTVDQTAQPSATTVPVSPATTPQPPVEQIAKPSIAVVSPPPVAPSPAPEQPTQQVVKPVAIAMPVPPPSAPQLPSQTARAEAKATTGGIYVQMASLDSEQAAQTEWQLLRARWPDLFGDRAPAVERAEVHERSFWRLRTGGFASVTDANSFCARLRAAGPGCWTVGITARN